MIWRLFRNGNLATDWAGEQTARALSAPIPLVAGENELTAYAFNRDNVRSKIARTVVHRGAVVARASILGQASARTSSSRPCAPFKSTGSP